MLVEQNSIFKSFMYAQHTLHPNGYLKNRNESQHISRWQPKSMLAGDKQSDCVACGFNCILCGSESQN